jgi:hypothetical protein
MALLRLVNPVLFFKRRPVASVKAQYQKGLRGLPFRFAWSRMTHGMSAPMSERFKKSMMFFKVFVRGKTDLR